MRLFVIEPLVLLFFVVFSQLLIIMHPFITATHRFGRDLLELHTAEDLRIDSKYAGTDNFMQKDLYQGFQRVFLHTDALKKFVQARAWLKANAADLGFLVFDGLRPRSVQKLMFDHVRGTPWENYVASPTEGSLHNYGLAIDLTLFHKSTGEPVEMGTHFDDFSDLAQVTLEDQHLASGKLRPTAMRYRKVLRTAMETSGFEQLPHEWWHYNAITRTELRADPQRWQIVE